MQQQRNFILSALVGLAIFSLMFGCARKPVAVPGGGAPAGGPLSSQPGIDTGGDQAKWQRLGIETESEQQRFLQKAEAFENEDIHFDFDSYLLTEQAKRILDRKIVFIKKYPGIIVVIEGHCDERGTAEYNLALGERRAKSVWQYLVNSGVEPTILTTISYGEERPMSSGRDEASWAKNRRVHFVLEY